MSTLRPMLDRLSGKEGRCIQKNGQKSLASACIVFMGGAAPDGQWSELRQHQHANGANQMLSLRPYQQKMVDEIRMQYQLGKKAVLAVLSTGGGKTCIFSYISQQAAKKGNRVCILVHRAELLDQASRSLQRMGVRHGRIAAGRSMDLSHAVQVASVQTLARRLHKLPRDFFQLLVVDECFPAGTLVDGRPIETIRAGDTVRCWDHRRGCVVRRAVVRTMKNARPLAMAKVRLYDETELETTLSHPIFTAEHGYIPAGLLSPGDHVLLVPGTYCQRPEASARFLSSVRPCLLQQRLQSRISEQAAQRCHGVNEQALCVSANARTQPNETGICARKDALNAASNGPRPSRSGWEWPPAQFASANAGRVTRLADGIHSAHWDAAWAGIPDALQTRHCRTGINDCDRSGWRQPFQPETSSARQEKGGFPYWVRVESVEVQESRGNRKSCGDYVYNLEVEEHHNYFAEGVLVHNCHHSNAGTWAKVISHFSAAKLLGVTATPIRGDGRGLGEWYEVMVQGPTAKWLTDNGYLAAARVLAPPGFDAAGLRKRMGDFDAKQAEQRVTTIMGDCCSHYRKHLSGRTAIAFCCSVAHAEAVARLFISQGVPAASIDGSMTGEQRRDLLQALETGRLKVLTSCALIGEGVDVPSVGGCILLRPTQSVSLHLQMIGRCLRPAPGKPAAVVLDHVGNTLRLGHHLEEREWSLDGIKKRDREAAPSVKVCPKCFSTTMSTAQICRECGHVFAPQEARELKVVDGELVELQAVAKRREQGNAQSLQDLIALGHQRGYKNPAAWAKHVLAGRQRRSA